MSSDKLTKSTGGRLITFFVPDGIQGVKHYAYFEGSEAPWSSDALQAKAIKKAEISKAKG